MGSYVNARKLSLSNEVTLVRIPGDHRIPGKAEADKLAKEGANEVPSHQTASIPFAVGKEVIRSHLRQEHLNKWKTCKGCCQSETLMS